MHGDVLTRHCVNSVRQFVL